MATIPSSNISISAINTEVDTVSSTSLKTLSDAAKSGSDPKDGAPYGMGEFAGYNHGPSTVTVTYTSTGPQGKIDAYSGSSFSPSTMPFGSYAISSFANNGSGFFRIFWSGGLNTGWTSITLQGYTLNRSAATVSSNTHQFYGAPFSGLGTSAVFTYP